MTLLFLDLIAQHPVDDLFLLRGRSRAKRASQQDNGGETEGSTRHEAIFSSARRERSVGSVKDEAHRRRTVITMAVHTPRQ